MPNLFVILQQFLDNSGQTLIGWLIQPITLGVIICGMAKSIVISAKIFHLFGLECFWIVSNDFNWTTKSRQNIVFQKLNDNSICGLPGENYFNPLGEIICGCNYPLVLSWRLWMNFSYEIKALFPKWCFDKDRLQRKRLQFSLPI